MCECERTCAQSAARHGNNCQASGYTSIVIAANIRRKLFNLGDPHCTLRAAKAHSIYFAGGVLRVRSVLWVRTHIHIVASLSISGNDQPLTHIHISVNSHYIYDLRTVVTIIIHTKKHSSHRFHRMNIAVWYFHYCCCWSSLIIPINILFFTFNHIASYIIQTTV